MFEKVIEIWKFCFFPLVFPFKNFLLVFFNRLVGKASYVVKIRKVQCDFCLEKIVTNLQDFIWKMKIIPTQIDKKNGIEIV